MVHVIVWLLLAIGFVGCVKSEEIDEIHTLLENKQTFEAFRLSRRYEHLLAEDKQFNLLMAKTAWAAGVPAEAIFALRRAAAVEGEGLEFINWTASLSAHIELLYVTANSALAYR